MHTYTIHDANIGHYYSHVPVFCKIQPENVSIIVYVYIHTQKCSFVANVQYPYYNMHGFLMSGWLHMRCRYSISSSHCKFSNLEVIIFLPGQLFMEVDKSGKLVNVDIQYDTYLLSFYMYYNSEYEKLTGSEELKLKVYMSVLLTK